MRASAQRCTAAASPTTTELGEDQNQATKKLACSRRWSLERHVPSAERDEMSCGFLPILSVLPNQP